MSREISAEQRARWAIVNAVRCGDLTAEQRDAVADLVWTVAIHASAAELEDREQRLLAHAAFWEATAEDWARVAATFPAGGAS
jgi:hypothetical protein